MKKMLYLCMLLLSLGINTKPLLAQGIPSNIILHSEKQKPDLIMKLYTHIEKSFNNSSMPGWIILFNTVNEIIKFNKDQDKYLTELLHNTTDQDNKNLIKMLLDKPTVIYRNHNKKYLTTYIINTNNEVLFNTICSFIDNFYSIIKINSPIAEYPDIIINKDIHEIQIELSPNNTRLLSNLLLDLKDNNFNPIITIKHK